MRTRARNRYERCVQVLRWLNEEFELAEEGALRFEWKTNLEPNKKTGKDSIYGITFERGGRLVIALSSQSCRTHAQAVETLIHEAAHVKLWDTGRGLLHGPEFWKVFGEMMDAFEHHGYEDSKGYFVD